MIIKEYSCTADTAAFRRKMFVLNFCKNQSENFILFLLQYKKDLKVSLMTNIPVPIVQILIDLRKNIYFPNLIRARDILPSFLILFAFKYIPQHACNLAPPWRSLIQELAKYTPSIINLLKSLGAKLWSQLGKNNDDLSPPIIQHVAATKSATRPPFLITDTVHWCTVAQTLITAEDWCPPTHRRRLNIGHRRQALHRHVPVCVAVVAAGFTARLAARVGLALVAAREFPLAIPVNEVHQVGVLLRLLDEGMTHQLLGGRTLKNSMCQKYK